MTAFSASSVDAEIARVQQRIAELEAKPEPKPILGDDWMGGLAAARKDQGLSQALIAQRINTTQSGVSDIERGLSVPQIDTLARYAAAVGYRMVVTFEPLEGNG